MDKHRARVAGAIMVVVGAGLALWGNAGRTEAETDQRIRRMADSMLGDPQTSESLTAWWALIAVGGVVALVGVGLFVAAWIAKDE